MVSTAWSIWWRGPEHNSWYNCYFADSLGKIQYLQLSGDSLEPEPPPQNLLDDIFLFSPSSCYYTLVIQPTLCDHWAVSCLPSQLSQMRLPTGYQYLVARQNSTHVMLSSDWSVSTILPSHGSTRPTSDNILMLGHQYINLNVILFMSSL